MKKFTTQKLIIIVLFIIALAGIGASGFLYIQYQNAQNIIKNPNIQGQREAKALVKQVSRLMLLPNDEQPTVATVSDYKKLKDQAFFKNAQNGNKVLIYTKAKTAILYDPKTDKIIAVAPVNLGNAAGQTSAPSVAPIKIALFNGTKVSGLTNTVEQQLKSQVNNASITVKQNAKNTYTKTLVVDLTGNQQKAASDLATLLKGETGSLPDGETAPANADLLVILGQ